jgi:hypothetical protein
MSIILKKKNRETVKKVSVKMKCGCYGQACNCSCPPGSQTVTNTNTSPDAVMCARLYVGGEVVDGILDMR